MIKASSVLITLICVIRIYFLTPIAQAEDRGVLTLDLVPDTTRMTMYAAPEFQSLYVKVVKITDKTEVIFSEFDITEQKDVNISVPTGKYKLYVQLYGHRTIWEFNNEGKGYSVSLSSKTIVPLQINTLYKDVFADAPWRVQSGQIPLLVMVKDADGGGGDYDLGNVEVYLDEDCDNNNNELDDRLLKVETKWYGIIVNGAFYNLYHPGDWYGMTYLDPSEYNLSGDCCIHVVIRDIGGFWDLDGDTHSHFKVTVARDALPTLANWHPGDTHYHSNYTDNEVEFGFPVEATVEAGKAIGLDWNIITDHSFDIKDSITSDPNHKWNALKSDVSTYTDDLYELILGEEVSCINSNNNVIHFLVFGMENFNNIGGSGLDFIPGDKDELGTTGWKLQEVIDNLIIQGGVGYGAHPIANDILRDYWRYADYDLRGYNGLQVWNGESTQSNEWLNYLIEGIEQWKRLLLNGRRDVFIAGGSDAHGDFSHSTHYKTTPPFSEKTDNAFGKVRTCIYTEDFSKESILTALKYGHSIMTDGPLVVFNVTNERGKRAIIGDDIFGNSLTLKIEWSSTSEFGNVDNIYVYRGLLGENEEEISEYSFTPNTLSGSKLYSDLSLKVPNVRTGYIRLTATTDKGKMVYTNPIWIMADSDRDGMPDSWENTHFGDLLHDGTSDSDNDGLTDFQEYENQTDPLDDDTDDDGMPDGVEDANHNGLVDIGETNPLNPDTDSDGYNDGQEANSGANPLNELSYPAATTIYLKKGFNLAAIPAEVVFTKDIRNWLPILGDSSEIEKVMVYDSEAGKFTTLIPGNTSNPSFILKGGEGLIVYAKQDKDVTFTSILCTTIDLKQGFNLVGIACPKDNYTVFQLIDDLGGENVSSIQRYATEKGGFETAGFGPNGQSVGVDFPIVAGEGYFIYMK